MGRTLLFEEKFGVGIDQFHSIEDIETYIKGRCGHALPWVDDTCGLIDVGGNVFPVADNDIDSDFDKMISE